MENKTYYIAMGGLRGCMPSHVEIYGSYDDAVGSLIDLYELYEPDAIDLRENGCLDLDLERDGNEYIEVVPIDESEAREYGWEQEIEELSA